jgi:hypothetical protein
VTLLWLDDARPAPPGWAWAKTAREALAVLRAGDVTYASLDCDLVDPYENGVWLVKAMVALRLWPRFKPGVHSSNWERGAAMLRVIRRQGPYDEHATDNGYPPPQGGARG